MTTESEYVVNYRHKTKQITTQVTVKAPDVPEALRRASDYAAGRLEDMTVESVNRINHSGGLIWTS
jgi:hypothetical protein